MSFWAGYWKSLKPLDVEEPIDVWVHRPPAYVLAKALLPTPVSPDLVTVGSIVLGVYGAASLFGDAPHRFAVSGVCLFLSAVFDCADGQLARLRRTSSVIGRMLDGCADMIVAAAAVAAGSYVLFQKFREPLALGVGVLALVAITAVTTSFHTSLYDHYKNVFLKLTYPGYREAESYAAAIERRARHPESDRGLRRLVWVIYLWYLKSQGDLVARYDPNTVVDYGSLGEFDGERAELYRRHALATMRTFRNHFGFGSLMFGLAVSYGFNVPEYYLGFRLLVLNAVFYGPLRSRQRAASRQAFEALSALPVRAH